MSAQEPRWRRYVRFFGPDPDADIDAELGFHLEQLEADLRATGLSPAEARDAARERFGDVSEIRRRLRRQDARRLGRRRRAEFLSDLAQDLRYAVRRLTQQPAFTGAVVGIVALGIGATTAMFTAVDAALLRPLPFARPDRLIELRNANVPFSEEEGEAGPRYLEIRDAAAMPEMFASAAAWAVGGLNLSDADRPVRVKVGVVSAGFFATLGVGPLWGRTFTADEGRPGGGRVVILSHGLWQRHLGGADPSGRSIPLNGRAYAVVGVMPRGFSFPGNCDAWIPLSVPTTRETFEPFRGWLPSRVIARVADGATLAQASARLLAEWERLAAEPATPGRTTSTAEALEEIRRAGAIAPLQRELVGDRQTALLVLLGATLLLLLIACVNVTNLLLARAAGRRREVAVRAVLGATRGRVVRQLLTESLVLSLAGTVLGLAVAAATLGLARGLLPASLDGVAPPRLDLRVLGFGIALATITGLGFGLWPALSASLADLAETIKAGGGLGATPGRAGGGRARRVLVAAELALALVLLVGAGLMLRSLQTLLATDPGLSTERVGTLELTFARGPGSTARLVAIDAMLDRLALMPDIEASGVINDLPLRGSSGISITFEADGGVNRGWYAARLLQASDGFFTTMGIPLRSGRLFTRADDSLAPKVAIISERVARDKWPGQNALGRTFRWGGDSLPYTVVGIVRDVRERSLDQEPPPQMYFPVHALPPSNLALVARANLPPGVLLARLQEAVRTADPSQAVFNVRMMDEVIGNSLTARRTNTILIAAFGALALLLAVAGVYAVVASAVAQRTRELGIRAALGAAGGDLVGLMAREMLGAAVIGLAVGLGSAWAGSRVLTTMVYGVTTHDPVTFALAPVALLVPVLIATLVPARRVLRLNPMDVIRAE